MKRAYLLFVVLALVPGTARIVAAVGPSSEALSPLPPQPVETRARFSRLMEVPFQRVRIEDAFWSPRIETDQKTTIPDLLTIAEEQGKIDNLRIIAGRKRDDRIRTYNSPDSDIWKIMEAASYTLAWRDDPNLAQKLDELISLYAEAQAEDGYINQMFMLPADHRQSPEQYGRIGYGRELQFKGTIDEWPKGIGQLYSSGHLFESAAAHYRATGKRNLLNVAVRMADRIYREFPPDKPLHYADHPQVGIGLIKLYDVTGDRRYLELADHIVHDGHHGRPSDLGDRESWKPIEEQRKAWGHAVRINYLYSAATDLCRYLDQPDTREALGCLWHSIVDRRIYLTGGVGGPAPAEQLADDYVLDNRRCYCECCANIAHGQWNHRLNLLHGDAKYADLVEIEAYNAGLSGISLDGTKYFYTNKLTVGKQGRNGPHNGVRKRYLFCCPAKLPGFVAGIGRWVYAKDERGIYVNLYVGSSTEVELPHRSVKLTQETRYPWDGRVTVTVGIDQPTAFDLCLRIPGWAQGRPVPSDLYRFEQTTPVPWAVEVNGERLPESRLEKGYVRIRRTWRTGDQVELNLPMPVRRVYADENVEYDRGRVALMRGPIVYCLEGGDHEFSVLDMVLPKESTINAEHRADLLGGVTVLKGDGLAAGKRPVSFTAIPYYAWQNRDIDEMTVWIVEDPNVAAAGDRAGPMKNADPTNLVTSGTISASCPMVYSNSLNALRDGQVPARSSETGQDRMAWWPQKGSVEWVQVKWPHLETTKKMRVYWFADFPNGGCKLPTRWQVLYLHGDTWKPVMSPSTYGTKPDQFVDVTFAPVTTKGLRIEVQLQKGFSGGIHEWIVEPLQNTDG